MTAADDDIDEDALLYGDVGACATRATTPTRRARRHTSLPLKLSRALDARTARKTRRGATDDDVRISHDPDDDATHKANNIVMFSTNLVQRIIMIWKEL